MYSINIYNFAKKLFKNLHKRMVYNTKEAEPYLFSFGIVLFIGFLGFYFFNNFIAVPEGYDSLFMRCIVGLLALPFILKIHFLSKFKTFLPIYFHVTLLYCLPFFFSYLLFKNPNSYVWVVNGLLGLVILNLFVDWLSYSILVFLGVGLGWICFINTTYNHDLPPHMVGVLASYLAPMIYFVLFSYKKSAIYNEQKFRLEVTKELKDQLEQKVEERTLELQQALAAKTEFLNNMSHEIRTPMQGFTSLSEGLVEHWQVLEEQKKYELADKIASNAKRLSSLLSHLLDLSKFQAGKMRLSLEKIDLNLIITEMIEEAKTLYINGKQLQINFTPLKDAFILADKERIGQVLRNLFVNSIKFSPNNSTITVSLELSEITYDDQNKSEAYHFAIKDEGIGVPENELYTIFEVFVQSSKTKTKAGGTGLGLAICKEIIEAHHGEIWAENNQDQGATFNFVVPISQAKQVDGHKIIAENNVEIPTKPTTQTTKTTNILIIDDEDACLMSMELLLFGSGYNLHKAAGGYAGLEYLKEHFKEIDLILLDLMMPDIYGLNVLAEIKQDPALRKIPVILQTGSSDNAEIERAFTLGIFTYIKKPYQKQNVIAELAQALKVKHGA
ncbi:Sensor histidine kinase [Rickettsiales bacterium Ac37b]|nr:Sensor histidine kinase [Rickettsiales bacterium Ac37b]